MSFFNFSRRFFFALGAVSCVMLSYPALGAEGVTRFGRLTIQDDVRDFEDFLLIRGEIIGGITGCNGLSVVEIKKLSSTVDVALVEIGTGGNGCPFSHVLVFVGARKHTVSSEFGHCQGRAFSLDVEGEVINVGLKSFDPVYDAKQYVIKNGVAHELRIRPSNFGHKAASSHADVVRWEGVHPIELFDEASERLRFLQVLSQDRLDALMRSVGVAADTILQDGFILGLGCMPHDCADNRGGFAIEVETGRPFVFLFSSEGDTEVFGGAISELPSYVRARLYEHIE